MYFCYLFHLCILYTYMYETLLLYLFLAQVIIITCKTIIII